MAGRRHRDLALLLPLAGLVLFMPPYLRILSSTEQLFGIPVLHLYIFSLWLLGILLTAILSRRLVRHPATEQGGDNRKAGEGHADHP